MIGWPNELVLSIDLLDALDEALGLSADLDARVEALGLSIELGLNEDKVDGERENSSDIFGPLDGEMVSATFLSALLEASHTLSMEAWKISVIRPVKLRGEQEEISDLPLYEFI